MPEVADSEIEAMSADEREQAAEQAVDAAEDEGVMGFAPRDS